MHTRYGYNGGTSSLWLTTQQRIVRWIGSQCQSSKSIHDEIHPEKLYSIHDAVLVAATDGGYECGDDGCHIHSQLELSRTNDCEWSHAIRNE